MKKTLLISSLFFSSVSHSFEQYDDRYPKYSVPIYPNEAVVYLNTNPPTQAIKESRNIQIIATTTKSRYFSGDSIRLNIDAFYKDHPPSNLNISFRDEFNETDMPIKPRVRGVEKEAVRYYAETEAPDVTETTTFLFNVSFEVESGKINFNIPIEINSKLNSVLGVDSPYKLDNDLIIPVNVEVDSVGMYRLTSTLFINKIPNARLMQQIYLSSHGKQTINLKVYGRLILDKNIFGEVEVRDAVLEKIQIGRAHV